MALRFHITLAALLAGALTVGVAPGGLGADPGARPVPAAERSQPGLAEPRPASEDPKKSARRKRVRERIRAMRAWYLTEQLSLDDATAARLFPLLGQFDDRLEDVYRRGVQLRWALGRAMAEEPPDGAALDRLVDDMLVQYEDLYRVQRERLNAVRKVVSPVQSAKLVLLLPRIDEAIRRQLDRLADRAKNRPNRSRAKRGRDGGRHSMDRVDPESPAPFSDPF